MWLFSALLSVVSTSIDIWFLLFISFYSTSSFAIAHLFFGHSSGFWLKLDLTPVRNWKRQMLSKYWNFALCSAQIYFEKMSLIKPVACFNKTQLPPLIIIFVKSRIGKSILATLSTIHTTKWRAALLLFTLRGSRLVVIGTSSISGVLVLVQNLKERKSQQFTAYKMLSLGILKQKQFLLLLVLIKCNEGIWYIILSLNKSCPALFSMYFQLFSYTPSKSYKMPPQPNQWLFKSCIPYFECCSCCTTWKRKFPLWEPRKDAILPSPAGLSLRKACFARQ